MIINQELSNAFKTGVFTALAVGLILSSTTSALANRSFAQVHPRRAEVLGRDNRLNNRINNNYGNLGGHYGQLEHQDYQIRQQEQNDARRNGGYITRGQQGQLNREENSLSNEVRMDNTNNPFVQNHPRRAEVLGRDANLGYSINKDEGHLGGQYGNLMGEDRSIRQQEQSDARANGGYITTAQQQQLNQEESSLRSQVRQDYNGGGGYPMQPMTQTNVSGNFQQ